MPIDAQVSFEGSEHNWKDPLFVKAWKESRRESLRSKYEQERANRIFDGGAGAELTPEQWHQAYSPDVDAEFERLGEVLHRRQPIHHHNRQKLRAEIAAHVVPTMISETRAGEIVFTQTVLDAAEAGQLAHPEQLRQAARMYQLGLKKKANRHLLCQVLGGVVSCKENDRHVFFREFDCHSRYCPVCGPQAARELFFTKKRELFSAAFDFMRCGAAECAECSEAYHNGEIPHRRGRRHKVLAILDFTVVNVGKSSPAHVQWLNRCIRRTIRNLARRNNWKREDYGYVWFDEYGDKNTNVHAHGIWCGPFIPKKDLRRMWARVTGKSKEFRGGLVVKIRHAESLSYAVWHACKYPTKFQGESTAEWRAQLEYFFDDVRRVHAMGFFYNVKLPKEKKEASRCPECGGELSMVQKYDPVLYLRCQRKLESVKQVRRRVGMAVARGDRSPPGVTAISVPREKTTWTEPAGENHE
jgi:hypothetical protein